MNSIENLIRADLRDFMPYSSARKEDKTGKIWLNANESPWNHLTSITESQLNRYPEQQSPILLQALADFYQLETEQILVSRGSDEGIDLILRLFCNAKKDSIIICPPTFGMYEVCGKIQGVNIIQCPLQEQNDFQIDLSLIYQKWQENVKVIFLCSPNNPTGNIINQEEVILLCEKFAGKSLIVVDEAYIEFADSPSLISLIKKFDNLIILRTLSKAFGLAGARIGTLLTNANIIFWLNKILPPYPLAIPSIIAAIQILQPAMLNIIQEKITLIKKERKNLVEQLKNLPIVDKIWSSQGNFILVKFKKNIKEICLQNEIVLRDMESKLNSPNTIRISIGTPEQNKLLIEVLQKVQL